MAWFTILILPYLIIVFKIYRKLLTLKPFTFTAKPVTKVSVVIACRNEEENLPGILKTLSEQDYPDSLLEIVIVDDHSSDKTFETAYSFKSPFRKVVLQNEGIGKKQALRVGINASSGTLIITTDADCTAGSNWISSISAFYHVSGADMIICPVAAAVQKGFPGWFRELEFLSLQGITAGTAAADLPVMCNGANLAFTREIYQKHSGNLHDEISSGDDIFLLQSIKKEPAAKVEWLESTDALITASSPPSIGSFLNQRRRWFSKWTAYDDPFTLFLGIATFAAILIQIFYTALTFYDIKFGIELVIVCLSKWLVDFLILYNTTVRYKKRTLMRWFIPSQIIYPFYVAIIALYSLKGYSRKLN